MTFEEYQDGVIRTLNGKGAEERHPKEQISYLCMGLAGETGELSDLVKKWLYHGHDMDYTKLNKEMGDVLWYLTALVEEFNGTLEDVAISNIAKLRKRYPEGFTHERSINRDITE